MQDLNIGLWGIILFKKLELKYLGKFVDIFVLEFDEKLTLLLGKSSHDAYWFL